MRCLLVIPVLAGLMFPPLVSAQFRIGPRSSSASPPGVSKTAARQGPARATRNFISAVSQSPIISKAGGSFSIVSPFRVETRSPWTQPAPDAAWASGFRRRGFQRQRSFSVYPFFSAPLPYANYGYDPQLFYPSLWLPLDQQYLQASAIAHGDVAQRRSIPTVFVYRDGRSVEVTNYAIFNQTLWVFDAETTRRIPLSAIDLPATLKLNEDRGVDVALPNAR